MVLFLVWMVVPLSKRLTLFVLVRLSMAVFVGRNFLKSVLFVLQLPIRLLILPSLQSLIQSHAKGRAVIPMVVVIPVAAIPAVEVVIRVAAIPAVAVVVLVAVILAVVVRVEAIPAAVAVIPVVVIQADQPVAVMIVIVRLFVQVTPFNVLF